jgi:hypothetical protein
MEERRRPTAMILLAQTGGTRAEKAPFGSVHIFAQVPSDALFMLCGLGRQTR